MCAFSCQLVLLKPLIQFTREQLSVVMGLDKGRPKRFSAAQVVHLHRKSGVYSLEKLRTRQAQLQKCESCLGSTNLFFGHCLFCLKVNHPKDLKGIISRLL